MNTQETDWEGLVVRVQALRTVGKTLGKNYAGTIPAIRRISRSLRFCNGAHYHPDIPTLTQTLSETPNKEMRRVFSQIFPRLSALTADIHLKKHQVLIVESRPAVRTLMQKHLGSLYMVLSAGTLREAESMVREGQISLLVLDLQMPDGDGRELLLKIREQPSLSALPVFVISSKNHNQVQTECFALGADNVFPQSTDPLTLSTAIAARLQKTVEIARHSAVDPLTGLPNRAVFSGEFQRAAMLASRSRQPLTVAMLDVDRFKAVNDIYGHAIGDQVLRRLASVLLASLRASDFLARWGGEEFAIFFPNTNLAEAALALSKALESFRAERFINRKGRPFRVTFSAGLARFNSGMKIERALAEADRILYRAKSSGRNHVLTEEDKVSLKNRILLVEDDDVTARVIQRHLKQDGFQVLHAKEEDTALSLADGPLSLITLDVKLLHGNGFSLLQRFRQMPALYQVPIVMLTSAGKLENIVNGFELGADDYIVKPFAPLELLARIHRLVDKHSTEKKPS